MGTIRGNIVVLAKIEDEQNAIIDKSVKFVEYICIQVEIAYVSCSKVRAEKTTP